MTSTVAGVSRGVSPSRLALSAIDVGVERRGVGGPSASPTAGASAGAGTGAGCAPGAARRAGGFRRGAVTSICSSCSGFFSAGAVVCACAEPAAAHDRTASTPSGETEARNQRRIARPRSAPQTLRNMTTPPSVPRQVFPATDCFDRSSRAPTTRVKCSEMWIAAASRSTQRRAPAARKRTAGSDPLDSDQGKSRRKLAANVDRHRELRPPCLPLLGTPAGHHLGTPRPMRSRVTTTDGRFPGSRVVAFDHLPRDNRPQWLLWSSARRLQLRGQLRNCIPVIAVGARAPHSLGYPLARNHR